jgi:hypothetical protein
MPPKPAAFASPLAPAEVMGSVFITDQSPPTPETLQAILQESQSREQVPGLLEIKDTHRP